MHAQSHDDPVSPPGPARPITDTSRAEVDRGQTASQPARRAPARGARDPHGTLTFIFSAILLCVGLTGSACSFATTITSQTQPELPTEPPALTEPPAPTDTPITIATLAPTEAATAAPSATPTATLKNLEILEWSEFPYAHPADSANTDTHVEVLIRNPNDVPVRVLGDGVELRFLNTSRAVVYANPNPVFYIWEGSWLLPGETAALSACVCFWTSGIDRQEWATLELVAPLEIAVDLAYTFDVDVTLSEFFSLAEAHLGGSGTGARITLTNTSGAVLESIPLFVFARDLNGRYIGMATYGNAVASFADNIGIQPGDTATGVVVNEIEYFDEPMTYEVRALGIPASSATTARSTPAGTPVADWRGVPIMPGALTGEPVDDGYQFVTQASIAEITQFYETTLAEQGYALTLSGEEAGITFVVFEKDSMTVVVGITPAAERNLVQIAVTP